MSKETASLTFNEVIIEYFISFEKINYQFEET